MFEARRRQLKRVETFRPGYMGRRAFPVTLDLLGVKRPGRETRIRQEEKPKRRASV
jgi:hypothetical protein